MEFKIGDRVKFSDEFLTYNADVIDPAITDEECQGTVVDIVSGKLAVRFDDGTTDAYQPEALDHL